VWIRRSVDKKECGKGGVWRMRSVDKEWIRRSVDKEEYG
jgi:Zn ribbon nucleic-acid-binding protein